MTRIASSRPRHARSDGVSACRMWWRRNSLNVLAATLAVGLAVGSVLIAWSARDAARELRPPQAVDAPQWRHASDVAVLDQLDAPSIVEVDAGDGLDDWCGVLESAERLGTTNLIVTVRTAATWEYQLKTLLLADRFVCPSGWLDRHLVEAVLEHGHQLDEVPQ